MALEEALFPLGQPELCGAALAVVELVEMADEVRPVADELVGREVEFLHQRLIIPPHGEIELVDAVRQQRAMDVSAVIGASHHQAREAHGLLALRRLDDAGDDIDLAALQAKSALLPGARHEDDLAPCIAAERLHEVRLHAVEIAGRILCDVRADMVYPHAQERPRLHT